MIFIYVMGREEGPVKIGISSDPAKRAASLQCGCPFKLEVLHQVRARDLKNAWSHEVIFHDVYRERRLIGEWFDMTSALAIEGVDTGFQIEAHFEGIQ